MNTATAITIAALAALTPTVTCSIGIVLARQDVRDWRVAFVRVTSDLRSEMGSLRSEIKSDMARLRSDHNADMAGLRVYMLAMRKNVHADLLMIHERVANVEGRQQS